MLVSIYNISPKSWFTYRHLWPRKGWDRLAYYDGHYVATIKIATSLVYFLFCQHRWKTSHGILASRSEVVWFTNALFKKNWGFFLQIWGAKTSNLWPLFRYFSTQMSHRQTKMLVSIYSVSFPKIWPTLRDLWLRNGWDPLAYCGLPCRRPLRCNHQDTWTCLVLFSIWRPDAWILKIRNFNGQ